LALGSKGGEKGGESGGRGEGNKAKVQEFTILRGLHLFGAKSILSSPSLWILFFSSVHVYSLLVL
jgi:hypothetical protein